MNKYLVPVYQLKIKSIKMDESYGAMYEQIGLFIVEAEDRYLAMLRTRELFPEHENYYVDDNFGMYSIYQETPYDLSPDFLTNTLNNDTIEPLSSQSQHQEDTHMDIYDYMYWGDYNARIKELADKAQEEKWSFDDKDDYIILKNYLKHTFNKLQDENKVIETDTYCVFDTGLFSNYYEPIYVYGEPNRNTSEDSAKWHFKGFKDKYELGALDVIEKFPERADYFSDPSKLVFNWHLDVNINYKHILDDLNTSQRLPDLIKNSDRPLDMLKGVIDTAVQRVIANYKLAVPNYYNNKIQLMIPLCFGKTDIPDVALVLDRMKYNYYQAATCLDMKMAYMDARLIAKPEDNWLAL